MGKEGRLENMKEVVAEFEERLSAEIKKQEKLDIIEEKTLEERSYWESIWQKYCINEMMENLRISM